MNTATNFPVNRVTGRFFEPSSGRLERQPVRGRLAGGGLSGSATVIGGPAVDGRSWQSRGLVVLAT